jgi:hypothetical protein
MSKIIKVHEIVDYSVSTIFTKDLGLFQVNAKVWSCVRECENGYDNEITETELRFFLNGKPCKYLGFKELYEKLFGANKFNEFRDDLVVKFEEEYFKQSPYKTK